MKSYKVISFWELLVFLFVLFLSLFLLIFYIQKTEFFLSHKGIKSLYKKEFIQAQKEFEEAATKETFNPWSYMNLALSYDFLNLSNKALKNYDIVSSYLKTKSNRAVFYSYFNQGELYGRLASLEKALENYQKALEFKYKEKEIKKNIELLFKKKQQSQNKKSKNQKNQSSKNNHKNNNQKENFSKKKQTHSSQSKNEREKESLNKNNQEKIFQKELSKQEQKAILEEIEKQENKVRARFFQRKKVFGDKAKKDW